MLFRIRNISAAVILAAVAVNPWPGSAPWPAGAGDRIDGPVPALVTAVIDGDTLAVRARIWLGQDVATRVRLTGIDAPEAGSACAYERALAERATAFLKARLGDGTVLLRDIEYGKYAGRVLARVESPAGEDLGRALLAAGLARRYDGGRREAWCPAGQAG